MFAQMIFIVGEVIVDELLKKGVRNICVAESSKLRVDDVLDRFADKVSTVRQNQKFIIVQTIKKKLSPNGCWAKLLLNF